MKKILLLLPLSLLPLQMLNAEPLNHNVFKNPSRCIASQDSGDFYSISCKNQKLKTSTAIHHVLTAKVSNQTELDDAVQNNTPLIIVIAGFDINHTIHLKNNQTIISGMPDGRKIYFVQNQQLNYTGNSGQSLFDLAHNNHIINLTLNINDGDTSLTNSSENSLGNTRIYGVNTNGPINLTVSDGSTNSSISLSHNCINNYDANWGQTCGVAAQTNNPAYGNAINLITNNNSSLTINDVSHNNIIMANTGINISADGSSSTMRLMNGIKHNHIRVKSGHSDNLQGGIVITSTNGAQIKLNGDISHNIIYSYADAIEIHAISASNKLPSKILIMGSIDKNRLASQVWSGLNILTTSFSSSPRDTAIVVVHGISANKLITQALMYPALSVSANNSTSIMIYNGVVDNYLSANGPPALSDNAQMGGNIKIEGGIKRNVMVEQKSISMPNVLDNSTDSGSITINGDIEGNLISLNKHTGITIDNNETAPDDKIIYNGRIYNNRLIGSNNSQSIGISNVSCGLINYHIGDENKVVNILTSQNNFYGFPANHYVSNYNMTQYGCNGVIK